MWLKADRPELRAFLDAAAVYWEKNLPRPGDDAIVVVEAFHQDIRVTLRNLVFANAIRRIHPARLVRGQRRRCGLCRTRHASWHGGRSAGWRPR